MKQAFLALAHSMKFWTTIIGILATVGAKYGIQVDATTQAEIAGLFFALLGAQAATDHGKAAAAHNAAAAMAVASVPDEVAKAATDLASAGKVAPLPLPPPPDQRGSSDLTELLVLAGAAVCFLGAVLLSGCGPVTHHIVADSETCAKSGVNDASSAVVKDVEAILRDGAPSWQAELDALRSQGTGLGEAVLFCSVETAMGDLAHHLGAGPSAADGASRAHAYLLARGQPVAP